MEEKSIAGCSFFDALLALEKKQEYNVAIL